MGRHHPPSPWRLPARAWRWLGLSASGVATVAAATQLAPRQAEAPPPPQQLASAPTIPLPAITGTTSPPTVEPTRSPAPAPPSRPPPASVAPAEPVAAVTPAATTRPPAPMPQETTQPLAPPPPPPPTTSPAPRTHAALGDRVVSGARRFLGVPYLFGGEDASGMDCSGLVYNVLRDLGYEPPRVAADQARWAVPISADEARPGDLVFRGDPAGHVGIYVGNGRMIDAPRSGLFVGDRRIYSGTYFRRIP